jgi:hypothetical protein
MVTFLIMMAVILSTLLAKVLGADNDVHQNYGYYSSVYGKNYYVDTQQTYYDGYAQAWRFLGWFVDCNGGSNRYYGENQDSQSGDNYNIGNNYCQRYLMWAAVSAESW